VAVDAQHPERSMMKSVESFSIPPLPASAWRQPIIRWVTFRQCHRATFGKASPLIATASLFKSSGLRPQAIGRIATTIATWRSVNTATTKSTKPFAKFTDDEGWNLFRNPHATTEAETARHRGSPSNVRLRPARVLIRHPTSPRWLVATDVRQKRRWFLFRQHLLSHNRLLGAILGPNEFAFATPRCRKSLAACQLPSRGLAATLAVNLKCTKRIHFWSQTNALRVADSASGGDRQ
jgi:hypothetical protein